MRFLSGILGSSGLGLSQRLGAYPLPNGDIGPLLVLLGVENRGREGVRVRSVYVAIKGEPEPLSVFLEGECPTFLPAGEARRYEIRARFLARACAEAGTTGTPKLTFVATDDRGTEHRHDFRLRVDEYLALRDE